MTSQKNSTLLFDGDCGICQEWVSYWQQLTQDGVEYYPYQQTVGQYPSITEKDCAAAIHLIEPDGHISRGAEATFRLYRGHFPQSLLLYLYRYLPGFSTVSEYFYHFLSTHRGLLAFITHLFWGRNFQVARHQLIRSLFLRLLGIVYLIVFTSFYTQADVLIGSDGILPIEYYLNLAMDQLGSQAYYKLPTLFWFSHSDLFINAVCIAGILFSVVIISGNFKTISLIFLYVLYLSLVNGGQVFMSFQWDLLLLECGFLAIFLSWSLRIIVWLYRWLLFRFMFLGGVVKIVSNDPAWDSLTALFYHFETQPLPSPVSWYVHHLPELILKMATGFTLIIELLVPFLIFTPRNFRHVAGVIFILFQLIIFLTGNYNFFNILTIFMCLFLFDDAAIKKILPLKVIKFVSGNAEPQAGYFAIGSVILMLLISIYIGISQISSIMHRDNNYPAFSRLIAPFGIVNIYGPFAVMTVTRHEIIIEGSADGNSWSEYQFKYKPGATDQCPGWVEPHQPRIDWQMWFAALGNPEQQRWLYNLLIRVLQGSEPVQAVFAYNPFPDEPPVSVRAQFYKYTFTSPAERKASGQCWNRELIGEYFPPMSIRK